MAEGLQYKIGADVSDFKAGVNQVSTSLNKLDAESKKAFTNIGKSANNAVPALNSLGQVARDLPFGFIAIQNNLPIVIDQFTALAKTSGGAGAAFKALAGSLLGPAGIAFAFGAIIAGVTSLIQKYGSIGNAIDVFMTQNDALSQQRRTLLEIDKEATKNAGEEIARLNVLSAVAKDVTNTLDNRKEAANELLKVYKEYLPNLTQEAILNGQAANETNRAKEAILGKARAMAAQNKLAELEGKRLDLTIEREKQLRIAADASAQEIKARQKAISEGPKGVTGIDTRVLALGNFAAGATGKVKDLDVEIKKLDNDSKFLEKFITGNAKIAGDAFIKDTKPLNVAKGKPVTVKADINIVPDKVSLGTSITQADAEIKRQFALNNGLEIPLNISIPEKVKQDLADFGTVELAKLQNKLDKTKEFSDALAAQLSSSFADVFTSLGEGIGQVFSGVANGFSIAQTVLSGLADVLINVGKLAISTGVAILGIKKALQTLNPAVAIAGGIALVALGTAVKGKLANSVPKFAEGGIVTRPTAGIFGEAGPEAVMPLDKLNSMLSNFGGSGNMQVSGVFVQRGNDLVAVIDRTRKSQGRVY